MRKVGPVLAVFLIAGVGIAASQSQWLPPDGGASAGLVVMGLPNASGRAVPISASTPLTAAIPPTRGIATMSNTSLGTTATQLIPAGPARAHMLIQNQSTSGLVFCTFNGVTPVAGTTGILVSPMGTVSANGVAGSFMPVGAVTCVASAAATPVYVSYLQ